MKILTTAIIIAILLYVAIAIITWDVKWITFHWLVRAMYLLITIALSMILSDEQS